MNRSRPILSLVLLALSVEAAVREEQGVYVLNYANFDGFIAENEFVLVEFYSPNCGHCKKLAPLYAQLAQKLREKGSEVKLAKVDAAMDKALANRFQISKYPMLKFFRSGESIDFTGGRPTVETMEKFINKKTNPPAVELETVADMEEFAKRGEWVLVGYFKDPESEAAQFYLNFADNTEDMHFGISSSDEVKEKLKVKNDDSLVMLKQFDSGRSIYTGKWVPEKILYWIEANRFPLVQNYFENTKKVMSGNLHKYILLIASSKDPETEKLAKPFRKAAKKLKGKLRAVLIDSGADYADIALRALRVDRSEIPAVRIHVNPKNPKNYRFTGDRITETSVVEFGKAFLNGQLKRYLQSKPAPKDWDKKEVMELVGDTFEQVAFDKSKNVFVFFHEPDEIQCRELIPEVQKLAKKYKDSKDVVIAMAYVNDSEFPDGHGEKLAFFDFPDMRLYTAGKNREIKFEGDKTIEGMVEFIENKSVKPKTEL